ncbi:hypothetical protein [Streptomyces fructofermentans]|uniref:Uncharacterized protein n=1 Tax=Streptomyces fructofermentans TaxID=152141 RepID=A0A918NV33_9ACTN|nr:hypothetical protein [Streptomyces fructofermentans]GGX96968.1 hypothetical protein GCM10010515_74400 [Streptomyces fructofermentans]
MTAPDGPQDGAAALINELEGHLLIAAALGEGRAEAGRFAGRFDWLTDSRRAEVEERFAEEYMALARRSWRQTAHRAARLRGEYEEAYRVLRRRLLAVWLSAAAALLCAAALLLSLA